TSHCSRDLIRATKLRNKTEHTISFIFFFSSRRRHTRWPRDWSSDVCSSDLGRGQFQHAGTAPCRQRCLGIYLVNQAAHPEEILREPVLIEARPVVPKRPVRVGQRP